tara:strand:+ start:6798 stop:9146 length:2349 start_codon:yes stop_codon:yes gene_type:complete
MGGAGGHMWHPFDCPDVNSGQDLIDFFQNSIEWAKTNKPALKIDGVNLSFRVKENPSMPTGYEFVVDRGSMKDLDVQGVTADNADQRFVTKDGSPHGMVDATRILLPIFNDALPDILDELEQLKMLEDIGPYSRYFNTEFVLKKINVKEYAFDFIALHSVNDFVPKGARSRQGVEVQYEQALLDRIRDKVKPHALKREFRVYSSITTDLVRDVSLERALNEEFTIVYSSHMRDEEEPGEMGIGEGSTKTIESWLSGVVQNPLKKTVLISDSMLQKYPKMNKKQFAMAKNIYLEILKGTAVNEIVDVSEDVEAVVDGAVVWHATRVLGNAVLDSLESEEFGPANEQEGVVIKDESICGGTRFKLTGDFIVGGLETTFREQKFRSGRLLESFIGEQDANKHVILIPGGFKPPTGGHYSMIKQYEKKPDVLKVFVVTGPKEREGVTLQQSKEIFDIYGGFSGKVEFITGDEATPLSTCYELVKKAEFTSQFPGAAFSIGAGDKGGDSARIGQFVDYFQARPGLTDAVIGSYPAAEALLVDGQPASSSRMRAAYQNQDWEMFKKLLPSEHFYDDVVQVLTKGGSLVENFLLAVPQSFLVERSLTSAEENKKEEIVHALKNKGLSKSSMYAIATDKAKQVAEETVEEASGMAGGAVEGPGSRGKKRTFNSIIREEEEELDTDFSELRGKMNDFFSNLLAYMPELADMETDEKAEEIDRLVNTISSQLEDSIVSAQDTRDPEKESDEIRQQLTAETSAVAAVDGAAFSVANPDTEEETNEQRRVAAGN